uniref:Transmembrane protein n=1 Tax=Plectus sambesii TaxID=2011161 RepID=A0A914UYX8_9BILA
MIETSTSNQRPSRRSMDPVDLWVNATPTPAADQEQYTSGAQPKSAFWRSFSQLSPTDQTETMRKIVLQWPYAKEYYAAVLPRVIMPGMTFVSAALIARPVIKTFLLPIASRANRAPILVAATTASMAQYAMDSFFVQRVLDTDQSVCAQCLTLRRVALTVAAGIFLPAFSFPYLCAYLAERGQQMKVPVLKSSSDLLALGIIGSKDVWRMRLMAPLLAAHILIGTAATYSQLWARDRIIPTLEDDPELFRTLLVKSEESPIASLEKYVGSLPLLRWFTDKK